MTPSQNSWVIDLMNALNPLADATNFVDRNIFYTNDVPDDTVVAFIMDVSKEQKRPITAGELRLVVLALNS